MCSGGTASARVVDVRDWPSVSADQVRTDLGDPTALVTAPVVNESVSIEDMPVESWRRMIDVNLSGTYYCLKAAIPAMKRNRYGRTVLFGSNIAAERWRGDRPLRRGQGRCSCAVPVHRTGTGRLQRHGGRRFGFG